MTMTAAVLNFARDTGLDCSRLRLAHAICELLVLDHDPTRIDPWDFARIVWAHEIQDTHQPPPTGAPTEGE